MIQNNLAHKQENLNLSFYRRTLFEYSSSSFDDDSWNLDKSYRDKNENKWIKFNMFNLSPEWLETVKCWTVHLLLQEHTIGTVKNRLDHLNSFLSGCRDEIPTAKDIYEYHRKLFNSGSLDENGLRRSLVNWNTLKQFFSDMELWDYYWTLNKAVVPSFPRYTRKDNRLIEPEVLRQLDEIFGREDLPNVFRGIYWSLRLIPNRVTEVLSLKPDCLQKTEQGTFLLTIPVFKQKSPFCFSENKIIELIPEGAALEYIEILKKQQSRIETFGIDTAFLFTDYIFTRGKNNSLFKTAVGDPVAYNREMANSFLKRVIEYFGVVDKNGLTPRITTHMFRHNNINDRIESGLFTSERIQNLSGHKSLTMLEKAYIHPNLKETGESPGKISQQKQSFNGHILEPQRLERIKTRPFSHSLGEIGVCSDIRKCQAGFRECLDCEYYRSNGRNPESYRRELNDWKRKLALAKNCGDSELEKRCSREITRLENFIQKNELESEN